MANTYYGMLPIAPTSKVVPTDRPRYRLFRVFVLQNRREVLEEGLPLLRAIDRHLSPEGCSRTAMSPVNVLCTVTHGFWYDDYEKI